MSKYLSVFMDGSDDEPKNTKIDHKMLLYFKTTVDSPNPEFPGTKNKKLLVDFAVRTAIIEPFEKICKIKDDAIRERELKIFGRKILEKIEELSREGLIAKKSRRNQE